MDLPAHIVSKIDFGPGCWLWMGATQSRGYGSLVYNAQAWLAHRFVYTRMVGDIADGMTLDHLCMVKTCVNPLHLEEVTSVENKRRETSARIHCLRGHPLAEANLRTNARGHRSCKTCAIDLQRTRRAAS